MKVFRWRISSKLCEKMGGGDFIQLEVFQALHEGKRNWELGGSIRAFRFIKSQLTAHIFLAHDDAGGIHKASTMWNPHTKAIPKFEIVIVAAQE